MSLPSSMAHFVPCDCLLQKAYSSPNSNRSHVTTQEIIVKSELKYEELVILKFNIASLTLSLFSDLTLKLFTRVWYRRKKKK